MHSLVYSCYWVLFVDALMRLVDLVRVSVGIGRSAPLYAGSPLATGAHHNESPPSV